MEFIYSKKVKTPLPVRVVLVRPEHSMNVGMVARVCKNFSVTDLALVNSRCEIDFEAFKFAKHSKEVLVKAKKFKKLEQAVNGFDLVIGTTGVVRRFSASLKYCIALPCLSSLVKGKKVAIVFGPEGAGLNESELKQCDVVTHIPAEKAHPVLNLSHSVAVVLYGAYFANKDNRLYKKTSKNDLKYLQNLFSQIIDQLEKTTSPKFRDPEKAKIAFKRVLGRSKIVDKEANLLMGVFARIRKKLFQEKK